jgi:hypothetical protein
MNRFSSIACVGLVALVSLFTTSTVEASGRQYYSGWSAHPSGQYSYRTYYYKPSPNYVGYKHHYVVHFPSRPAYNYYYNPYTKQYWGRCPSEYGDKPVYSMLAEADRNGDITKIAENKFPPASAKLPSIPESKDSETLDLPPDDLPDAPGLPVVAK